MRSRSLAVFSCLIALMMVYSAVYASDGPFGVGVQTDLEAVDGASAAAIQPDGKIVVAGPSGADFALARNGSAEPVRVTFDPPNIRIGGSFNATFLGPNLTNETYFDLRFRGPDELITRLC